MSSNLFGPITIETFIKINHSSGRGYCPVCGGPLEYNYRTGKLGQWAHFISKRKGHILRYGEEVINSKRNGAIVCSLGCNNAVQLNYATRPVLCDGLAEWIKAEDGAIYG